MLCFTDFSVACYFLHAQGIQANVHKYIYHCRVEDDDDEMTVNDHAVDRLVIVTQVSL